MSHYLKEFPDYDSTLPVLDGFVDDSWHNDTCPSLVNVAHGLKLWCEYANPKRRTGGCKQYILYHVNDDNWSDDNYVMESDNIEEIKKEIKVMLIE